MLGINKGVYCGNWRAAQEDEIPLRQTKEYWAFISLVVGGVWSGQAE